MRTRIHFAINPWWHWTTVRFEATNEWKCVTHRSILMAIDIRESMQKIVASFYWPWSFIGAKMVWCAIVSFSNRFFCCCCRNRRKFKYPLFVEHNAQCAKMAMWKMTRTCSNVYPWYCTVIDLMPGIRFGKMIKKRTNCSSD